MNRRLFICTSCAIALAAGTVGIATCSKDEEDPDPAPGGGNGNPKLTANLDSELTTVGSSKIQNNIILVRTAAGNEAASFVALTAICTHEHCIVGYQSSQNRFVCPCHGSIYDISGAVLQGPAPAALAKYTVSINNNILTVS